MPILPHFGRQKKFFNNRHFLFWQPPIGKFFTRSAADSPPGEQLLHSLIWVANTLATPKFSEMRERGATTRYRPQEVSRFASGRSADRTSRCRKSHRQRSDIFGSARLCAVPLDLLTQACLLYDSLSSWGA